MSRQSLTAYAVFILAALTIYLGAFLLLKLGWISLIPSFTVHILAFFLVLTSLIYKYIIRFSAYGAAAEMQLYLGSIVLKLLVGCGLLWALSVADKPNIVSNAVLLLVSYAVFTTVGIQQLMAAKKG